MKKQYVKPECVIEDFRMDTSVASGCGYDSSNLQSIIDAYLQIHADATEQDIFNHLNELFPGEYCYHTSQGINIFNS